MNLKLEINEFNMDFNFLLLRGNETLKTKKSRSYMFVQSKFFTLKSLPTYINFT